MSQGDDVASGASGFASQASAGAAHSNSEAVEDEEFEVGEVDESMNRFGFEVPRLASVLEGLLVTVMHVGAARGDDVTFAA
ncbi:hypothetical protein N9L19_00025 [bacterium]|nr:hypothetical protein [bacterium]